MDLASLAPLAGGWSGRTFLAHVAGERQVVRLYLPEERTAPEVDAAVLRLVRGLLPVPEVLEVRAGDAATDTPGLLVTAFVPGERGDVVLPGLDDAGLRTLGGHVGELVAVLGGMPVLATGRFADAALTVEPWGGPDGLPELVAVHEPGLARDLGWSAAELAGLWALAVDAQELLDTVERRVLVHSDLNPKNLLVDPDTLAITALVDWEYAHAGHPATDLGNVLRFERQPAYADAVLDRYRERHGGTRAELTALARAADLWALLDLAGRAGQHPVADAAADLLRERAAGTADR